MPKTSTPSINSEVAIGRRMKGSEMLIGDHPDSATDRASATRGAASSRGSRCRRGRGRREPHAGALRQPELALDDNPLAERETLPDHGDAVLHRGHLYRAPLDRAVFLDHISVLPVRTVLHSL